MISQEHAQRILHYLQLKPDETIAVVGDETTQGIVMPVLRQLIGTQSVPFTSINLDDSQRPLQALTPEIELAVKGVDVCFYAIDKKVTADKTELPFRRALNECVESNGGRVGNFLAPTEELIESVFSANPQQVTDLTNRVLDYMQGTSAVRVWTPKGTDVIVEFDPQYKWLASTGYIQKGIAKNISPAEVYTHPGNVNGQIVVDGTYPPLMQAYLGADPKKLLDFIAATPILWTVKDGRIVSVKCEDEAILKVARKSIEDDENSNRIGEYGMGTNFGIPRLLGIIANDEKIAGVHFANGHGYPKLTGAQYNSKTHADAILTSTSVIDQSNGRVIMDMGKYKL
ncbi:aminopeptidase [Candidatus Woesearchaeota archaeon]|nr:aminopeptidase [Candidatus Woesearchaeota archaeon]